jgi:uncharacterized protein YlxP (DUF503 family)
MHIPSSQSLKDKRQVMKSLIAQVQRQFQIAAGEVGSHDLWQTGVIGLACISTDTRHADQILARAVGFLSSRNPEATVLEYETEIIHAL